MDASENSAPEPIAWLAEVGLDGSESPVRVVFVRREGSNVIVRQADPSDGDPPRVPLLEGDRIGVATALSHLSLNTTPEIGDVSGLLLGIRIVEDRREGNTIYARTLRTGEEDDGRRVHVAPGETVTFDEESISVELEHIDGLEQQTDSGLKPLTPVLATWFQLGDHPPEHVRYLLAGARRLDEANRRMIEVAQHRASINEGGLPGPELRRHAHSLLGGVESAIIALGRTTDMVTRAHQMIGATIAVPESIARLQATVTNIRNAYEHIEDRAVGRVRGKPDPDALTIFDYERLIREDVLVYATDELSLVSDVPLLLAEARSFLLDLARGHAA